MVVASLGILVSGLVAAPASSSAAPACGPAPANQVAVIVIVDGPGGLVSRCATVPDGSTGADALTATGHSVRNQGGFMCAIDSQPASGCAVADPTAPYWSYWTASPGASWSYSRVGAFGRHLPEPCAVEGWRLVDPVLPRSQAAPRIPVPDVTCVAAPTTVARPAGNAPQPAPAPGASPVPGPAAVAPGGAGAVATRGLPPGSTGSDPRPATAASGPTVTPSGDHTGNPANHTGKPAEVAGETTSIEASGASVGSSAGDSDRGADGNEGGEAASSGRHRRSVAPAAESASVGGGSPLPAVAVGAVLVLLAGTVLWRRRVAGAHEVVDDSAS